MAPSPTIPTSFVPKQPVRTVVERPKKTTNIFTIFGFVLLLVAMLASAAVFGYQKYLEGVRDADAAALAEATAKISRASVEDFIRTNDRFSAAMNILDNHVAFSRFLDKLEEVTLQNVRFSSLNFTLTPEGAGVLRMSGAARSFNALANESNLFTDVKEFNRAIFSGIGVNEKDGNVTFSFSAEVDKSLFLATVPTEEIPEREIPVSGPAASSTGPQTGAGTATTTP